MKPTKLEAKIPPLREIPLNTRPLAKRAVEWSCDGELAVAADDSVHVFVPLFPDPEDADDGETQHGEFYDDGDEVGSADDDGDDSDLRPAFLRQKRRRVVRRQAQFNSGHRQILVSHPRLHPKVNRELFELANLPFPCGGRDRESEPVSDADSATEEDQEDEAWAGEEALDDDITFGAGKGVIASAGSTLNHVVSIAWSPSGLGCNRRPVLAVLTSAGYIGFYGDSASTAKIGGGFASMTREDGTLKQRDLSSWAILFGAGERLIVPGQQMDVNEKVISIAWAREVGPGQALIAYINDVHEVAVLNIQSISIPAEEGRGVSESPTSSTESKERMVWRVHEVARFRAEGPHLVSSPWDPDWVPCGTSFGVRWSPWLLSKDSRSCVLSYVDKNYVGFRKITLKTPWAKGTDPDIVVEETDTYGKCVSLSTDGFVEFEDAIWTKGESKVARGLIATGFHVKPFEVSISGPQSFVRPERHTTDACGTTYPDLAVDRPSTNPIVDLIIHPPNMMTPTATPTYTLIRLSATSTNHDWFQTNASLPDFSSSRGITEVKPQWAVDIGQKLAILVPADAHMRHTAGVDDDDSDADSVASGKRADDLDSADGLSDGDDEVDIEKAVQAPEVHPTRFRMHGLTAAPGGNATAVLVSAHSTQTPDRIGWWGLRSVLLFSSVGRPPRRNLQEEDGQVVNPSLLRLTTEGRMLNWMYGAGPDVPGITTGFSSRHDNLTINGSTRGRKEMFRDVIASQRCDFCGEEMAIGSEQGGQQGMSICRQGHFFSTCGASGLAIQAPGVSHTCGVCGVQTLKIKELLRRAPALEVRIKEELAADVCGNCGGKFVD